MLRLPQSTVHCPLVLLFMVWPALAFGLSVPPNDGFITDEAGLLSVADDERFEEQLRQFREETDKTVVVAIIQSLGGQTVEDATLEVGREWGVGQTDNGASVLVLIAYEDRQITIDPSPQLEDVLPIEVLQGIVDHEMLPFFREGQYAAMVAAGVSALQKHIGGELATDSYDAVAEGFPWMAFWKALFLLIIGATASDIIASMFRPSSMVYFGVLLGVIVGFAVAARHGIWLVLPLFALLGLACDFFVHIRIGRSKQERRMAYRRQRRR